MCSDESSQDNIETVVRSNEPRELQKTALDGGVQDDTMEQEKLEGIFRVLTSQRRRYILYELQEKGTSDLETLATIVTATEQDVSPNKVDTDEVDGMKSQLVHSDIPLLEDAGFVEYDHRSRAVRYSDPPAFLNVLLNLSATVDRLPEWLRQP